MIKKSINRFISNDLTGITVIFTALLLIVIFKSTTGRLAFSLTAISKDVAIFTIVGLAQMATLAVGQFNLAVGAMGGAAGMVCGYLINLPAEGSMEAADYSLAEVGLAMPWLLGILVGLLVGFLLGILQGSIIVKTKINPFIITLALISVIHGFNMWITENMYFRNLPLAFKAINKFSINRSVFIPEMENCPNGIPIVFLVALATMLVMWVIYNRTGLGRKMLATGVSTRAADYAGINSGKYTVIAHGISGTLCALAGILTVSKLGVAQTSVGDNWLLYSFASTILGGTLLSGGKVGITGTMIGAGIMLMMTTVLAIMQLSAFTHQIFIGGVLLFAFMLNKGREILILKQDKMMMEMQESVAAAGGDKK